MIRVFAVWGLAAVLAAQGRDIPPPPAGQSAPAGEVARAWTAHEALAAGWAQQLALVWSGGEAPARSPLGRVDACDGYDVLVARRDEAGVWQLDASGDPARAFAPGDVLCYLAPHGRSDARRLFCVRGDGVFAFTDNLVGTRRDDGRALAGDDALGDGGTGTLRDFPRTPGRGRDGNLWLPGEQIPKATLRLRAVDERGEPLGAACIATRPAAGDAAFDAVLPAGTCRTRLEGDAVLQGPPARGLQFVYVDAGTVVPLAAAAIRLDGATARVTVDRTVAQRAKLHRNESAAIATLKNISSAQAQCQASGVIDVNGNGAGEYGTFAELAGRDVVRGGKAPMVPPVLSTAFSRIENGIVQRSGYCFRIFLPGKDGVPVAERANGGPDAAAIDSKQAEARWCVFAWPIDAGVTGQRAFWIDQGGDVLASPNADGRYTGPAKAPLPDAARTADSDGTMLAPAAANQQARDGQTWVVIG